MRLSIIFLGLVLRIEHFTRRRIVTCSNRILNTVGCAHSSAVINNLYHVKLSYKIVTENPLITHIGVKLAREDSIEVAD